MGSLITYENLEDGQKVTANIFNERFAQIVSQINGKLSAVHMENASITKEKLATEVYESIYPVGSMYVNFTDDTNPATLLGFGTWSAVAGRMVVGYDGTQSDFNASEKTGGSKDAVVVSHTHRIRRPRWWADDPSIGSSGSIYGTTGSTTPYGESESTAGGQTSVVTAGESGTSKNLPPYIVGYIWKRTS